MKGLNNKNYGYKNVYYYVRPDGLGSTGITVAKAGGKKLVFWRPNNNKRDIVIKLQSV